MPPAHKKKYERVVIKNTILNQTVNVHYWTKAFPYVFASLPFMGSNWLDACWYMVLPYRY